MPQKCASKALLRLQQVNNLMSPLQVNHEWYYLRVTECNEKLAREIISIEETDDHIRGVVWFGHSCLSTIYLDVG